MNDDPDANLTRLLVAREAIEGVSGAEPLAIGIDHWIEHGSTFEEAFGVKAAPGSRSARSQLLRLRRDRHLTAAWELLERRTIELRREIDRFEGQMWPALADQPKLSTRHSRLTRALHAAFRCGVGIPRSTKRLHEAVTAGADMSSRARVQEDRRMLQSWPTTSGQEDRRMLQLRPTTSGGHRN